MSQSIFQVRPQDAGKGWAIDEYDGRGAWQSTYSKNANGEPLDKQEAQRKVFQLRRKALNSAKTETPVNKADGGNEWAVGLCCTRPGVVPGVTCPDCAAGQDLYDAEAPGDECSICRRRHGREVEHARE